MVELTANETQDILSGLIFGLFPTIEISPN